MPLPLSVQTQQANFPLAVRSVPDIWVSQSLGTRMSCLPTLSMLVSASSSMVWITLTSAFASRSFKDGKESSTIQGRRLVVLELLPLINFSMTSKPIMGCSWSSWLPTLLSYSPFRLGLGIGNWSGQHPQVKQWLQRKPLPCLSQLQHPPGRTLLCSAGLYCRCELLRLCCSIPSRIAASSAFNSVTSVKRLTFIGSSGVLSSTEAPLPLCGWSL